MPKQRKGFKSDKQRKAVMALLQSAGISGALGGTVGLGVGASLGAQRGLISGKKGLGVLKSVGRGALLGASGFAALGAATTAGMFGLMSIPPIKRAIHKQDKKIMGDLALSLDKDKKKLLAKRERLLAAGKDVTRIDKKLFNLSQASSFIGKTVKSSHGTSLREVKRTRSEERARGKKRAKVLGTVAGVSFAGAVALQAKRTGALRRLGKLGSKAIHRTRQRGKGIKVERSTASSGPTVNI